MNTSKVILIMVMLPVFAAAQSNSYLKKYAGTYYVLADRQKVNSKTDKYVLTADGKCSWTFFPDHNSNVPVKKPGTWKASEGLMQIYFDVEGGAEGGELLTDFRLQNGAFRAEGIFLQKVVPKTKPK